MLAEKYPRAFFGGAVALAKTIRWDTGTEEMFDGALTPDEIMDKLEERVGPEGRSCLSGFTGGATALGGADTDLCHRTLRQAGAGLAASPFSRTGFPRLFQGIAEYHQLGGRSYGHRAGSLSSALHVFVPQTIKAKATLAASVGSTACHASVPPARPRMPHVA
jgi:hypothetical protein